MLIRDSYKLIEISEIIYEEKEGKFVFRDARGRIIVKLGLPDTTNTDLIEFTIQIITKLFQEFGYVDIYSLNESVDKHYNTNIKENSSKENTKIPTTSSLSESTRKTEHEPCTQRDTFSPKTDHSTVTEETPMSSVDTELSTSEDIGESASSNDVLVPNFEDIQCGDITVEQTENTNTSKVRPNEKSYLADFLVNMMSCNSIKEFQEHIALGNLLNIPKEKVLRELQFVSKKTLLTFSYHLDVDFSEKDTQRDLASKILDTLNY